jgi:NADPH:quinone reductase-like Zn-dependent oxidoreductase
MIWGPFMIEFFRFDLNALFFNGSCTPIVLEDLSSFLLTFHRLSSKQVMANEMPLSEIREAHRIVEKGEAVGKILLRPWS